MRRQLPPLVDTPALYYNHLSITNTCASMTYRRGNESELTYALKWAAWQWMYVSAQCRIIGFEVSLEGPGGRIVDLAGIGPDKALYVVEVKSSRSDFRRDDHDGRDRERLREQEETLDRVSAFVEETAREAQGEESAQQATLDAELIERRITNLRSRSNNLSTKFHDPRFIRIADYNYVMAPVRAVRRSNLPPLWGLLSPTPTPNVVVQAPRTGGGRPTHMYAAILRAISRANTRDMMRGHGVQWTRRGAEFPDSEKEPE